MVFQGSLLYGFVTAAGKLIESTDSDIWITARGVVCFDLPATFSKRLSGFSKGIPGVASTTRVVMAMAEYRKPDGAHQMIALVGADPEAGAAFPVPYVYGLIELEEGPLFGSNVVECDPDEVYVGMPVEVVFDDINAEISLPKFRPRKDGS